MINPTFSVNLNDEDGDVYDECLLLHFDNFIMRFTNLEEYDKFIDNLKSMKGEIKEVWDRNN